MEKYKKKLVSIIIPTITRSKFSSIKTLLKKRYLLENVIKDISENVSCPYEIIVINNSIKDKKLSNFIVNSEEVNKFCINSVNAGVPRSWNIGANMAQGEYLCFVNDDVEIGAGALEKMIEVLSTKNIGQVGPSGTQWHRTTPGKYMGLRKIEEADAIAGWLFMVKRQVFDCVGGFDIAYTPALCEEIDFSFAIRDAGYKCLVIPEINAKHHHISGASSTKMPIRALDIEIDRETLTTRNREYFSNKWSKFWD